MNELMVRDAGRDLDAELQEAVHDLQYGKVGRVSVVSRDGQVREFPMAKVRLCSQLSQTRFAEVMGVSA